MRSDFRTDRSEAKTAISAGQANRRRKPAFLATTAMAAALTLAGNAASAQVTEYSYTGSGSNIWSNNSTFNWSVTGTTSAWNSPGDALFEKANSPPSPTLIVDSTIGAVVVNDIWVDATDYGGGGVGDLVVTIQGDPITLFDTDTQIFIDNDLITGAYLAGLVLDVDVFGAATDVEVNGDGTLDVTRNFEARSFDLSGSVVATVGGSGTLEVFGGGPVGLDIGSATTFEHSTSGTSSVNAPITSAGTLNQSGSGTLEGISLEITDGTVTVSDGKLDIAGMITNSSADTPGLNITGGEVEGSSLQNSGTVTLAGGLLDVDSVVNSTGSVLNLSGTGATAGVDGSVTNSGGTVNITGAVAISGTLTQASANQIDFDVDGVSTVGGVTVTSGEIEVTSGDTLNVTGTGAGAVTIDGGTLDIDGVVDVQSATAGAVALSDGQLALGSSGSGANLTVQSGGVNGGIAVSGSGQLSMTAADSTMTADVSQTGGDVDAQGTITGSVTSDGGTFDVMGDLIVTGDFDSSANAANAVTLTGDLSISGSAALAAINNQGGDRVVTVDTDLSGAADGTITLAGAIIQDNGETLTVNAASVILGAGFDGETQNGGTLTFGPDMATLTAQTDHTVTGNVTYDLIADGQNDLAPEVTEITLDTGVTANGNDLTATNGGAFIVNGTVNDAGAILVDNGGSIEVASGQTLSGTGITVTSDSGADATVSGDGTVTTAGTLAVSGDGNLTVEAGATLEAGALNLTSTGTLTVEGTLRGTGNTTNNDMHVVLSGVAGALVDETGGNINNDATAGAPYGVYEFDTANGTVQTSGPGGEQIVNQNDGVFDIDAANATINAENASDATDGFINQDSALITVDSTGATINVISGNFNNSAGDAGEVNAHAATDAGIQVGTNAAGDLTINAEGSIINSGNIDVAAGSTLTLDADVGGDAPTTDIISQTGGTFTNLGTVDATGEIMSISGGMLDHDGTAFTVGTLAVSGTGDATMSANATITTLTLDPGGDFDVDGGTTDVTNDVVNNGATVEITAGELDVGAASAGDGSFTNTAGTLSISGTGVLDVGPGVDGLTNSATFNIGGDGAGAGAVIGDVDNQSAMTVTDDAVIGGVFLHSGGTVTFGGNSLTANEVDISASLDIDDVAGSELISLGDIDVTAGTATVNANAALTATAGTGDLDIENGATVSTAGTTTTNSLTNDGTFTMTAGTSDVGVVTNNADGIVQHTGAGGTLTADSANNNAGIIRVTGAGGGIDITGTATGNTGTIENTGSGGTLTVGNLDDNSGTITNASTGAGTTMTVGDVTNILDGQLNQTGSGTLTAGAIVNNGNPADIAGPDTPATVSVSNGVLDASSVTNTSGLVSVTGGDLQADTYLQNGATAEAVTQLDDGTITMTTAAALTNTTGTLNFNGGRVVGSVTNTGTINVQSGSGGQDPDVTGTLTQTGGTTIVSAGSLDATAAVTYSGGTLDFSTGDGAVTSDALFTYSSNEALTLDDGDSIVGGTVTFAATSGAIENDGLIQANNATPTILNQSVNGFNNTGALTGDVDNVGILTSSGAINGDLDNTGTANLSGTGSDGVNGDFENDGTTVLTGDLGVDGTFTQTSGTVDFNGPATADPGFTLSATLADIDAALDVNGGRLDAAATEVADAVALTISDDTGVGSAELGELTMEGPDSSVSNTGSGQVDITSVDSTGSDDENLGTIENTGTGTIVIDSTFLNQGTLENSGALSNFTVSADLDNVGIVEQSGTGTFTVASYDNAGTGSELNVSDGLFTMGGALLNQTGTVNLSGGGLTASGGVTNSDDFNVTGGTLTANVLNTGGAANFALDSTAADGLIVGNVVNEGVMSLAGDDGILGITQGIDGNLTNQAGGAITLTGDLEVDGAFTQGNTGGDAGSVTFDGNRLTATSVTIDAPLTIDDGGILESTGAVAINEDTPGDLTDDLTIANGSTLLASGQTVTVAADARVNNQAGGFVAAGTIVNAGDFTNAGTVGADENGDARDATDDTIVHGITALNNAGTFNAQAGSVVNALDFNNNSGGGFNLNGNTTLNGIPDQAPATSVAGGNFTNAAGSTFDDAGAFTLTLTDGDFTNNITNGDMLLDNGGMITVSDGNFVNNGTLTVQGAASVITVSNAASSFSGGGIIDLEDGASAGTGTTDDVLTINGAVTGGATLRFDVDLSGAGATDVLNVTSFSGALSFSADVLATGGIVSLDLINGDTTGLSFASGNVITSSGSNTYLLQNNGVGGVDIVTDTGSGALAVAGNISLVQSLIGTIVNRPSSPFVSGLAYEDDDNCGTGSWARFTGGSAKGTARTNNGVTNLPSTVEADFYGFTGGVDYGCFDVGDGAIDIAGGMILGYNGGSTTQDVFATNFGTTPPSLGAYQSTTTADFSQTYVGGYVAMAKDAWSADVQLRFENAQFEFNNPSIDLRSAETETQSTTLSGSVSYSYPLSDDLTLVPTAGFGITRSSTDDLVFTDAGGTETGRLSFEDHTTKIGFVGATIAKTTIGEAGDSATNKFITATYYGDFSDDQQATYTSGGATLPVTTESLGDFGELSIGLSYIKILDGQVGKAKQLNASVRADARFSEDVEALSLTAQVRLQF
ncbi:hypothetical protein [Oceanicola sp. 502str15]|uniref:hypothetical protein n=1 Tax=Oceanicola sp. 502str15 TaxID=2696061 RepID=UPI0020950B90|nr:hypothetical protein [Oceanicola sp. 502str15]MCO6381457.1 hypothetical protein [Oceanicola sp. 502str15]